MTTAGIDYQCSDNSSLGAIFAYTNMQPDANNQAKTNVIHPKTNKSIKNYKTETNSYIKYNRYNANLHYTLSNIKKGGLLNLNADYLNYAIDDIVYLHSLNDEKLNYKRHPENRIEIYQTNFDMEMPIRKGAVSYGVSFSQSETNNKTYYEQISIEENLNDHFIYREHILAAFADLRFKFSKHWDFKVGVRGEYGKLDGQSIKMNQRTIKQQFDIFPTVFLNYMPRKNKILYLNVSSRINRPSYVDINPFITYNDAHTITKGNPNLFPEKLYTAELGSTLNDFNISANAIWKDRVISSCVNMDNERKITTITTDNK